MVDFKFAMVFEALVRAYGVAPEDEARFRGRLTLLQRGGLFGAAHMPGKGKPLAYRPDQMHRWVFCLELAEIGITPAAQLQMVKELWESRIQPVFDAAEGAITNPSDGGDVVMLLSGLSLMTGAWAGAAPVVGHATVRELPAATVALLQPEGDDDLQPRRVVAVNLTARLRVFHTALSEVHLRHYPPDEAGAAAGGDAAA